MRRSELTRSTSLTFGPRKAMKASPSKRDWTGPRAKVDGEGCRVCSGRDRLEAAHLVPRSQVKPGDGEHPDNIVRLCRKHHAAFDAGRLDLLPWLTRSEMAHAVLIHPFGLLGAYHRLTGRRIQHDSKEK